MSNFIRSIDQIGKEFKFKTDGEESFTTFLGGIITIIYYLGTLGLLCFFGKELIIKEDPNFIQRVDIQDKSPYMTINETNFFMAIGIVNRDGTPIFNLSYFDIELLQSDFFEEEWNKTITNRNLNCNESELLTQADKSRFDSFYCFNLNNKIGGYWNNFPLNLPQFIIRKCNDATSEKYNVTCASNEEILSSFSNNLYLYFYFQNRVMNPQNYSYPIKTIERFNFETFNFDQNQSLNYEIYYNEATLKTDSGLIFESIDNSTNFIEIDTIRKYYGSLDYLTDYTLCIQILLSNKISYYSRTYIRFQDVIANVSAFTDLIFFVMKFLYDFYLDNEYSVFLYKKLFKLQIEEEEIIQSPDKISIIPFKGSPSKSLNKDNVEPKNLKHIDNEKDSNKHVIHNTNYKDVQNLDYIENNNLSIQSLDIKSQERNVKILNNKTNPDQTTPDIVLNNISKRPLSQENNDINNSNLFSITPNKVSNNGLNKDLQKIIISNNKPKKLIEVDFKERCYLLACSLFRKEPDKEEILKKELILAADKVIDQKSEIFELLKYLDQNKLLKKILLNENQCFMLNQIGLKEIVNKNDKERQNELSEIKDLEELKDEERKLKLIEYYKSKNKSIEANNIDDLLWLYLDDSIKQNINEALTKLNS